MCSRARVLWVFRVLLCQCAGVGGCMGCWFGTLGPPLIPFQDVSPRPQNLGRPALKPMLKLNLNPNTQWSALIML